MAARALTETELSVLRRAIDVRGVARVASAAGISEQTTMRAACGVPLYATTRDRVLATARALVEVVEGGARG